MNKWILITGAFDVMHVGHIRLLKYASLLPDKSLIVMIDTDSRIRETKGQTRPFNCFYDRQEFLLAIKGINIIYSVDSDQDIIDACKILKPIRIVGSDWKDKPIIGGEFCAEILYFDRIPGYSTTRILENDR